MKIFGQAQVDSLLSSISGYLGRFGKLGAKERRILEAIKKIDRKGFMPENLRESAYFDEAMPIGKGQTISQPSTVARMLQLLELKNGASVLEIGTGSGWNAALIGECVGVKGKVLSTEVHRELAEEARRKIKKFEIKNVKIAVEDFRKISQKFDRIIFTCGISKEQEEIIWKLAKDRLEKGGVLVCPFGYGPMIILKKDRKGNIEKIYTKEEYVFVPLVLD